MEDMDIEKVIKKRLTGFISELLKVGTVKGFKYFAMYLRGREELIISVLNKPTVNSCNRYIIDVPTMHNLQRIQNRGELSAMSPSASLTSNNLPYDKRSLMLSARTQMSLSGMSHHGVGLPPASPSENETSTSMMTENSTLFLIAAYTRYKCPYVWVRSNHDRLITLGKEEEDDKDNPLRLRSTSQWANSSDIQLWHIINEVVKLCTIPAPANPFQVDFEYFDNLPLPERVISTGAMVNFLHKVIQHDHVDRSYTAGVMEDLNILTKKHFKDMQQLICVQGLPILQEKTKHMVHDGSSGPTGNPVRYK